MMVYITAAKSGIDRLADLFEGSAGIMQPDYHATLSLTDLAVQGHSVRFITRQ